jgi:predicted flavoprotein YhiN
LQHFKDREIDELARKISAWKPPLAGTEGYPKAEVTLGGVDPRGLSSKTMEARAVPGLFFIGEVLDVTGWLGGYNFQWAWSSGYAAGQAV